MATYVAVTTTNGQNGFYEVARGSNKEDVRQQAEEAIGGVATGYGTDIYKQTEHANLHVVSKTEAKRKFGVQ